MNPAPLVALVGNPNAGKSALFNALTGARQKVGNYPGVTVERKSGRLSLPDGRPIELIDLPGAYSLEPASPDEAVTRDVVLGRQDGERQPDVILVVMDATNLDNHLRFALQLIALGIPIVVALNMIDMAKRDGLEIDVPALSRALGVPVIATVAEYQAPRLSFHGDAGIVADLLARAGQRIEQGALAGIGVADQRHQRRDVHCPTNLEVTNLAGERGNMDGAGHGTAQRDRHPADPARDRSLAERRAVQDLDADALVEAELAQPPRLGDAQRRPIDRRDGRALPLGEGFEAGEHLHRRGHIHPASDYQ